MEKETVKIADKQVLVCRHLKQKTTDHIDEQLRLENFKTEVFRLFFSCYVRILQQGSKIQGGEESVAALLVNFGFSSGFAGQF